MISLITIVMIGFLIGLYFGYSFMTRQGMAQYKKEDIVAGALVLLVGLLGFALYVMYPSQDPNYMQLCIILSSIFIIIGISLILLALKYNFPRERTLKGKKIWFLILVFSALLTTAIAIYLSFSSIAPGLLPTIFFFLLNLVWAMSFFFGWSYLKEKLRNGN